MNEPQMIVPGTESTLSWRHGLRPYPRSLPSVCRKQGLVSRSVTFLLSTVVALAEAVPANGFEVTEYATSIVLHILPDALRFTYWANCPFSVRDSQ
ncbi:MAG: hypothetical protein ACJAX5_000180 [Patiriisocius sp.]|jgi:hypothetical protein